MDRGLRTPCACSATCCAYRPAELRVATRTLTKHCIKQTGVGNGAGEGIQPPQTQPWYVPTAGRLVPKRSSRRTSPPARGLVPVEFARAATQDLYAAHHGRNPLAAVRAGPAAQSAQADPSEPHLGPRNQVFAAG